MFFAPGEEQTLWPGAGVQGGGVNCANPGTVKESINATDTMLFINLPF